MMLVAAAALLPLAAYAQSKALAETNFKRSVYVAYGYSSLNQVNQSRYALQGVQVGATQDFAKYFGVTGEYGDYFASTGGKNPGSPEVKNFLAGPVLHGPLFHKSELFVNVLLGVEHTGGETYVNNYSFSGGFGYGVTYSLSKRISIRAAGERLSDSYSLTGYSASSGASAHRHWNSRASFGLAYAF